MVFLTSFKYKREGQPREPLHFKQAFVSKRKNTSSEIALFNKAALFPNKDKAILTLQMLQLTSIQIMGFG